MKYTSTFPLKEGEQKGRQWGSEEMRKRNDRTACILFSWRKDRNVSLWLQRVASSVGLLWIVEWTWRWGGVFFFLILQIFLTTFLIWNNEFCSAHIRRYFSISTVIVPAGMPSSYLVNYVKILLLPHCFFGIVYICFIVIQHTVYNMSSAYPCL